MTYAKPAKLHLLFKEFVDMYGLKDQATSNNKIKEGLDKLTAPAGLNMRDDQFTTTSGIVNLHPTKGTHWVMYTNKNYQYDTCPAKVESDHLV